MSYIVRKEEHVVSILTEDPTAIASGEAIRCIVPRGGEGIAVPIVGVGDAIDFMIHGQEGVRISASDLKLQDGLNGSPVLYSGSKDDLLYTLNNEYLSSPSTSSTTPSNPTNSMRTIITQPSDYPADANDEVIFESGQVYELQGDLIDYGTSSFIFRDGTTLMSDAKTKLTATAWAGGSTAVFNFEGSFFVFGVTLAAGDFNDRLLDIASNPTASPRFWDTNFENSGTMGTVGSLRNIFFYLCGFFGVEALAFQGSYDSCVFDQCNLPSNIGDSVLEFQSTVEINRRIRFTNCVGSISNGGSIVNYGIAAGNIGKERFQMVGCTFEPDVGESALFGIDETSDKAFFKSCEGMPNTSVIANAKTAYQSGLEPTTTLTLGNYSDIAVDITGGTVTGAEFAINKSRLWEIIDENGTPVLIYKGEKERTVEIQIAWTLSSSNNRELRLLIQKGERNAANAVVTAEADIPESLGKGTSNGNGNAENISTNIIKKVNFGDSFKFRVANFTDNSNANTEMFQVKAIELN